jgi:maleylacetoacetate isomerase/maleylpyruvate isomerase
MSDSKSDFVLYNYFRSSTSYRVRIALNLKNIIFQYKPIHLLNNGGEQHSAEYRAINPMGGVPSLVHNGKVLSQSRAILEYLDEVLPSPALLPSGAYEKAKVRQICDNINCEMHPLMNLRVTQYLEKNFAMTEQQKNQWMQNWSSQGFLAIEKILFQTAGKYSYGDQITLADIFLIPQIFSALRFNIDLGPYPIIRKINEECLKLAAFQKAHPYRQVDTPEELKMK